MRRRRAIFIAATVAAALFATLSLGAREDVLQEPTPETCKTNLQAVFDWCGSKANVRCMYVAEEEIDACDAGCVMALCPEQITCTELDPMWCGKSCADPSGARYWSNSYRAYAACDGIYDDVVDGFEVRYLAQAQRPDWEDCQLAYMKEQCPELTGWPPPRHPIIHANR